MKGRPKLDAHVQMSVMIAHDVYRQLHELRLARSACGAKLPALGTLVREALTDYVERSSKTYEGVMLTMGKAVP